MSWLSSGVAVIEHIDLTSVFTYRTYDVVRHRNDTEAVFTLHTTSYDRAGCLDARCRTTSDDSTTPDDVVRCRTTSYDNFYMQIAVPRGCRTIVRHWRRNWTNFNFCVKRCSHCARHRTTALDALTHDVGRHRTTQRHRRCRTMSYNIVRQLLHANCRAARVSHDRKTLTQKLNQVQFLRQAVFTLRTTSHDIVSVARCHTTSYDIVRCRWVVRCRPTSCVKASSAVVRCRVQCEHRLRLISCHGTMSSVYRSSPLTSDPRLINNKNRFYSQKKSILSAHLQCTMIGQPLLSSTYVRTSRTNANIDSLSGTFMSGHST